MRQKLIKSRLKRYKLFTIKEETEYNMRRPKFIFKNDLPESMTPSNTPRIDNENKSRCVIL